MSLEIRNRVILSVVSLLIFIGVVGFFIIKQSQDEIIEQQAVSVAEIVVRHASSVRELYLKDVSNKSKHQNKLTEQIGGQRPFQSTPPLDVFTINLSIKSSDDSKGLFRYRLIDKWNLPSEKTHEGEFVNNAWAELEKQERQNFLGIGGWKSIYKIEKVGNIKTLMFLKTDPAASAACIKCQSNQLPVDQRRQVFSSISTAKKHEGKNQLKGAFFVEIPLGGVHSAAIQKTTKSIIWIVIVLVGALITFAYFIVGDVTQDRDKSRKLLWQAQKVLSHSGIACYAAKDSGRNRVQVYQENNTDIANRFDQMSWVSKILAALDEKKFVIFAQEIRSISKHLKHSHFEVLVRWVNDEGAIVPPNEFLPAAERYGLMNKIDTYVIDCAFEALSKNQFIGLADKDFVSINVSGQSLSDALFLTSVTELMEKYDIDPCQICFEVTETSAIKNLNMVRRFMYSLKSKGVRFALDDFGLGLSSLTYLKQFPVDYFKIDGSFVKDIMTNSVDRKLVNAINQLAHTMNIKTIAKYVETQEILTLLGEMKVDYAQGYHISKPRTVEVA